MPAPSQVGSVIEIKSSAGSGSQSVTVPSGATLMIVATSWWASGVPDYTTLSQNGVDFKANKIVENASDSYECTNIYYLKSPATGTFSWAISTSEGAHIFIVFLQDTDSTTPVRASNYGQSNTNVTTGTFASSTNDLVFAVGCAYGATSADAGAGAAAGQTELFDGGNYNFAYGLLGTKAGVSGNTTYTINFTGSGKANSVCAASIAGSSVSSTTGTLSKTLGALTSSGAAAVAITATFTRTLGLTSSSASNVDITGAITKTLATLALSGVGQVTLTASLSKTLGALLIASGGNVDITGTAGVILSNLLASGSGSVDIGGASSVTLGALSSSASGNVDISALLGVTLAALSLVSSGTTGGEILASLAGTLGTLSLTGSSQVDVTAALQNTLANLILVSGGNVDISASLLQTLGALLVSSSGVFGDLTIATLSQTLGTLGLSSAAAVDVSGIMAIVLNDVTGLGSGTVDISASLSKTLGAIVSVSAGNVSVTGSLSQVLGVLSLVSAGIFTTGGFSLNGLVKVGARDNVNASIRKNTTAEGETYTVTFRKIHKA